ncbi:uncharacterized protein LOC144164165 [Haemaphysalis longicornis]
MTETAATLEEMTTTMDIGTTFLPEDSPQAPTMHVNHDHGRVAVAVTGTDPTTEEEDDEGWQVARRRMRRQAIGAAGGDGGRGGSDVCPYPDTEICFACGAPNPGPTQKQECTPRCKLCGGAHPTGVAGCKNRYKTPHVVKQRRWERKRAEEQRRAPPLGLADFPQLRTVGNGAKRTPHRNADVNRAAAATTTTAGGAPAAPGGGETSRRSGNGNQVKPSPREGVTWAAAVTEPRPKREANPQELKSNAPQQQPPQPTPEMIALRNENARLKAQLAQQERHLQEVSRKLDMLLAGQQPQHQQQQIPDLSPRTAHRQAQRQARAQEQEQDQEQMQTQEPEQAHAAEPRVAEPIEEETTTTTQNGNTTEEDFGPRAKRRATVTNAIERRHQQLEERMDRFGMDQEAINRRLAALEATTADMNIRMTNMERILAQIQQLLTRPDELTHQQQQQHPSKSRPTWPEQR